MKNKYTVFSRTNNDAVEEPMFFGNNVNVARYDKQKYPIFEKLINKQLGFFWRPEEVELFKDKIDFNEKLTENEQFIFTANLKYQTLLDSVQGRSPNVAFLPIVSLPELETWIETWSFSETIHSRSYTHILRNVYAEPSKVLDVIVNDEEIGKRAGSISKHYDNLIYLVNLYSAGQEVDEKEIKKALMLTVVSVNVLEAIRFYVSFACSYSFAERGLMEGNAKIIKLINRDEALHLAGTQRIIQYWMNGSEGEEMRDLFFSLLPEINEIFEEAANEEIEWSKYLFKGGSVIGLNADILTQYVKYLTNTRMTSIGLDAIFEKQSNPIPWINTWTSSSIVQVAPQETEISSYISGGIDSNVSVEDLSALDF
jgi:ribonucleoside-diphosphate reductase beta chain